MSLILAVVTAASLPAPARAEVGDRGAFAIVAPAALAAAADAWEAHRAADGWRVLRVVAEEDASPEAIRAAIRNRFRAAAPRGDAGTRRVVLLLGDVDAIPTFRFRQRDPQLVARLDRSYATDHPYQCIDGGDAPALELGRIPARSDAEALSVLEKIRAYESAPSGAWRHRVAYVAGEGRYGAADRLLEWLFTRMVDRLVPDAFDVSMLYAKADSIYCPPTSSVSAEALSAFSGGALLVNYVGHGTAQAFDVLEHEGGRERILGLEDLAGLGTERATARHADLHAGVRPIAVLTCCSAGWFDLPGGAPSLAEAMLLHPGGPVAVIAGSRLTHPYANAVLQKDVSNLLLRRRTPTVGELDLALSRSMLDRDAVDAELDLIALPMATLGRWPSSLDELRQMHVRLYNLLGDPATHIALPPADGIALRLDGTTLVGAVQDMASGTVAVTLETARTDLACPPCLSADPDPEIRRAQNFAAANDRVLERLEGVVTNGAFRIDLPGGLPKRAALVKARATGVDGVGRPTVGVGVLRAPERSSVPWP